MVSGRRVSFVLFVAAAGLTGCLRPDEPADDPAGGLASSHGAIVGGKPVDVTAAPYQVSLQKSGQHACGGSILTPTWIVTAQHCVMANASSMRVVAGISKLSEVQQGQIRPVAEVVRYPRYRIPSGGKDVALLRLAEPLDLSTPQARPIGLVTPAHEAAGVTAAAVMTRTSGWGVTRSGGSIPDELQEVEVPIVAHADASTAYAPTVITEDQIAAGYLGVGEKDACQGDSGGPLVVEGQNDEGPLLAGIVSWGVGCAEPKYPGMYARVSSFTDWIDERINSTVPVRFTCEKGVTLPGQSVYALGSAASLGSWDPANAVRLNPEEYPTWSGTVLLPPGAEVTWKCIKRDERRPTERLEWQSGANNVVQTPAQGTAETSGRF